MTLLAALFAWEAANAAVQRYLARLTREAQAARSARLRTLLPMFRTALLVAICLVAGLIVLSEIGVNIAPLLAGAGVVGLAIGFGSQRLVQDIITGLFLLLENTMQVGDVVTLGGLSGTVEALSIRTIRLRALDGSVHIIPFSAVTTVTNMTRDFGYAVLDISVGLNEEPDRVTDVVRTVAREMRAEPRWASSIRDDLEVLGVEKFIDLAFVLRMRIQTLPGQRWAVARELNRRIKLRFDELAIESPITSFRALSTHVAGAERQDGRGGRPDPPPGGDQNASAVACTTSGSVRTIASTSSGTGSSTDTRQIASPPRCRAAEMEGRDVDAGARQRRAEPADEARLVLVGDVQHVAREIGLDLDALDLDDARPRAGEQRAGDRRASAGRSPPSRAPASGIRSAGRAPSRPRRCRARAPAPAR